MITEWSMTSSAGASGLTLSGSPPSSVTASRMVARSTTQGTPVSSDFSGIGASLAHALGVGRRGDGAGSLHIKQYACPFFGARAAGCDLWPPETGPPQRVIAASVTGGAEVAVVRCRYGWGGEV